MSSSSAESSAPLCAARCAKLLAIETSSLSGGVAGAVGTDVRAEWVLDPGRRHGRDLVPSVQRLLGRLGWAPAEIDVVAVSIGPGSYTGLRVGLSCARALAYVAGARLVGVNSLEALARNAPSEAEWLAAVVDAQRGDVYSAEFRRTGDALTCTRPVAVVSAEAWAASLRPGSWVVGEGLKRHARLLEGRPCTVAPAEAWLPTAGAVAALGFEACQRGAFDDLHTLEPLYLRRPSAVEKWEQRQKERETKGDRSR